MERKTKIIIGIITGVVVVGTGIGIGIYYHNKNKKKGGGGDSSDEKVTPDKGSAKGDSLTSDETTSTTKEQSSDTVKVGSKGLKVGMFQAWLNWKYNAGLTIDGRYGTSMRDAARKYLKLYCNTLVSNDDCNLQTPEIVKKFSADATNPKFLAYYKPYHLKLKEIYK